MSNPRKITLPPLPYDKWLILAVVAIVSIGLLMVASASIVVSDHRMHQPFYFFYRQLIYLGLGVALSGIVIQFEIILWERYGGYLLIGTLLLLALVLFPGIGHSVNGSMRWIGLSIFSIQVSELAKFAMVVYMAGYLLRCNRDIKTNLAGFLKPISILSIVAVLLLKEPDFGATAVIMTTALGMMFLAGMRLRHFVMLLVLVLGGLSVLAVSAAYRILRLTSFLKPWENPYTSGYQLTQSLIAFGRGGWFGEGLGNSVQKHFYLPEAHTDFLFAIIAEEFGLMGVLTVIGLFSFVICRIFWIGKKAQLLGNHFAGFLAYGFALWLAIQFGVNIGVNVGLLPTKGLTLPLMSYGGSSMLINCIIIALVLRIDYENRTKRFGM
jgi:cell division protein FtsW